MMSDNVYEVLNLQSWNEDKPSLIKARAIVGDVDQNANRDADGDLIENPATWETGKEHVVTPTRRVTVDYLNKCRAMVDTANQNEIEASDALSLKAEALGSDVVMDLKKVAHGVYLAARDMGMSADAGMVSLFMHSVAEGLERAVTENTGRGADAVKAAKQTFDRALLDSFGTSKDALKSARARARRR